MPMSKITSPTGRPSKAISEIASSLLIVCEDITEQKRAEEAAQRSENELRDVIKLVPAFVWTATPEGSIDFVNERWQAFTGLMMMDKMHLKG
jgi:PAS domain-containing protein